MPDWAVPSFDSYMRYHQEGGFAQDRKGLCDDEEYMAFQQEWCNLVLKLDRKICSLKGRRKRLASKLVEAQAQLHENGVTKKRVKRKSQKEIDGIRKKKFLSGKKETRATTVISGTKFLTGKKEARSLTGTYNSDEEEQDISSDDSRDSEYSISLTELKSKGVPKDLVERAHTFCHSEDDQSEDEELTQLESLQIDSDQENEWEEVDEVVKAPKGKKGKKRNPVEI